MQRLELPDNTGLPFPELIGRVADYLLPFAPMWRAFWLQAVAVLDGENWLLHHLALVGQWSEFPDAERFCDYIPGGAVIAVSQPIDDARFREILVSLRTTGTMALPHDITARTPSDMASSGLSVWQVPFQGLPSPIEEIAETAPWRDLHVTGSIGWHPSANSSEKQEVAIRLKKALRADLDRRGEPDFEAFLSTKFTKQRDNVSLSGGKLAS